MDTGFRLTADPVVAASRCNHEAYTYKLPILASIGGLWGYSPWNSATAP